MNFEEHIHSMSSLLISWWRGPSWMSIIPRILDQRTPGVSSLSLEGHRRDFLPSNWWWAPPHTWGLCGQDHLNYLLMVLQFILDYLHFLLCCDCIILCINDLNLVHRVLYIPDAGFNRLLKFYFLSIGSIRCGSKLLVVLLKIRLGSSRTLATSALECALGFDPGFRTS